MNIGLIYFLIWAVLCIHHYFTIFEIKWTMEEEGVNVSFWDLGGFSIRSVYKKFLDKFDFTDCPNKKQDYYRLYKRIKINNILVGLVWGIPFLGGLVLIIINLSSNAH